MWCFFNQIFLEQKLESGFLVFSHSQQFAHIHASSFRFSRVPLRSTKSNLLGFTGLHSFFHFPGRTWLLPLGILVRCGLLRLVLCRRAYFSGLKVVVAWKIESRTFNATSQFLEHACHGINIARTHVWEILLLDFSVLWYTYVRMCAKFCPQLPFPGKLEVQQNRLFPPSF